MIEKSIYIQDLFFYLILLIINTDIPINKILHIKNTHDFRRMRNHKFIIYLIYMKISFSNELFDFKNIVYFI